MGDFHWKLIKLNNLINSVHPHTDDKSIQEILKEIETILDCTRLKDLQDADIMEIVSISMSLATLTYFRLDFFDSYFKKKRKIKICDSAFNIFKRIIKVLHCDKLEVARDSIIEVLDNCNYLADEYLCAKFVTIYLEITTRNGDIINSLLDKIEQFVNYKYTLHKALYIFKWMSDLVSCRHWPYNDEVLLIRMVDMHISSIIDVDKKPYLFYLREGLEICMKRIIRRLSQKNVFLIIEHVLNIIVEKDVNDESLIFMSYCLEGASKMYKVKSFMSDLDYVTLQSLLFLISSKNKLKCALGNQIFQNILNMNNNLEVVYKPRIFFTEIKYSIKIRSVSENEWQFIKRYRQKLHITFLAAMIYQQDDLSLMQSIHASLALLILEIPTPYTTVFLVCLIMNIQKVFLKETEFKIQAAHRAHAIVLALMSLVCWVMNIQVLNQYVMKVIQHRASTAPFLNPPLRYTYDYADHYILWARKEFFFSDFEVKYALWKRFRLKEEENETNLPYFNKNLHRRYST